MSKELKLSPWHSGDLEPMHVGVYQKGINRYSYWNGNHWKCSGFNVEDAYQYKDNKYQSAYQNDPWRGILK